MTQGVPNFSLSWLSSEDDDKWLTSSLESEFMKDFNENVGQQRWHPSGRFQQVMNINM